MYDATKGEYPKPPVGGGATIMLPSPCPLDDKPFDLITCTRCRHYGGRHLYNEIICYAYGGTLEITRYNKRGERPDEET